MVLKAEATTQRFRELATTPVHAGYVVRCQGLAKRCGVQAVLQGFDLEVQPGEVFGIICTNSSSNTMILSILAGLLAPNAGTCSILGQVPAKIRRRIGYMMQGQGLYPHLTVAENLQVRAMLFGLPDVVEAAAAALRHYGLAPHADTQVAQLSDGLARRAEFVAALVHDPDLLLLDEPTVGLDAAARQEIWRDIPQLAAGGVTAVVSTQDLTEAEHFSRLAFIVEGIVRAQGTVAEVVKQSDACSFTLRGHDTARAGPDALRTQGIVAAYPSTGGLRVITRSATAGQAHALAQRHGLQAVSEYPSLDDAARALLYATSAG